MIEADPTDHPDGAPLGAAATAAVLMLASIGQVGSYITPFTLTALMRSYGIGQGRASTAISVEILLLAAAMFVTSRLMARLPLRLVALLGVAVALAGQLLTVFAGSYALLIGGRMLCGAGAGSAMAIAYAAISRSRAPARLFTIQSAFLGVLVLAMFLLLPHLRDWVGPRGQFLAIGLALAVSLPLCLALKDMPLPAEAVAGQPERRSSIYWLLAGAVVLCGMGSNAIWLHFETLGELRHLSFAVLVALTTLSAGLMIVAPLIALWLYRHVGGFAPFIVCCLVQGLLVAVDLLIDSSLVFLVCAFFLNLLIVVLLVYARIIAAEVDSSGASAAAVGGADFVGGFTGPLLGGFFIVTATDNWPFVAALLAAFFGAVALGLWGNRRLAADAAAAGPIA